MKPIRFVEFLFSAVATATVEYLTRSIGVAAVAGAITGGLLLMSNLLSGRVATNALFDRWMPHVLPIYGGCAIASIALLLLNVTDPTMVSVKLMVAPLIVIAAMILVDNLINDNANPSSMVELISVIGLCTLGYITFQ